MSKWIYDAPGPAFLAELDLDLEPEQEFDAPDSWHPEPNPHPVYKPAKKKTTPIAAPKE